MQTEERLSEEKGISSGKGPSLVASQVAAEASISENVLRE